MIYLKIYLLFTACLLCTQALAQFNRTYLPSLPSAGTLHNEPLLNVVTDQQSEIRVIGQIGNPVNQLNSKISFSTINNAGTYQSLYLYSILDSNNYKAQSLAETPQGDFIIVGSISPDSVPNQSAFAMKVDASGNVLWTREFPGFEFRLIAHLESDSLQDYFVLVGTALDSSNNKRLYCVKIDANGAQWWAYMHATYNLYHNEDVPNSLAKTDSAIAIVGTSLVNGNQDVFALSLNYSGLPTSPMMFFDVDSLPNHHPYILADDSNSFYYISFTTGSNAVPDQVSFHALAKLDNNWNQQWVKLYRMDKVKFGVANMLQWANQSPSEIITAGSAYFTDTKSYMPYTFVIDDNGDLLAQTLYPKAVSSLASSFTVHIPQSFFVLHTHYPSSSTAAFDLLLTDAHGRTECDESFIIEPVRISFNQNSSYYLTTSLPDPHDSWIYSANYDVRDISCRESHALKNHGEKSEFNLKFMGKTMVASATNTGSATIQVYNLAGQLVHQSTAHPTERIDLTHFSSGIYLIRTISTAGVTHYKHYIE